MIAAEALSKRYGAKPVVDRVSFELRPGEVTGLIGRGGAGKSILLRMVVGLVRPSTGSATVLGQPYGKLERAPAQVGVALGAMADPGDTVAGHLRFRARLAGASAARVSDTLERVGLSADADRRVGELGFGSRQRLELGGALVGDPEVFVIDEPTDGLDVDGREWLHGLLRELATARRTVLVATRDIPALGPALDAVLVMEAGRLVGQSSAEELLEHDGPGVLVQSPGAELLAERLHRAGVAVEQIAPDTLRAIGVEPATLGETVKATGVPVHQLAEEKPDLERAYLEFTRAADGNGASAKEDGDGGTVADARFAELAQRLEAELAGAAGDAAQHVVAVVAPGPTQGRSTIAFLVADVLARHAGAKPLLVGLSAGPVGGHATAALESASSLTVDDVLRDLPGFDELAQLEPYCSFAPSGVALLAGPARPEALADVTPREVEELCAFAGRFHDVLVLDLGAVNPAALRATIAGAACVLLVGAQDATEQLAASPVPDLVAELQSDPPIVVVNRTEAETAALAATVAAGDGHVAMPFDRQLVRLLDAGEFDPDALDPASRAAVLALGAAVARRLARC